MLHKKRRVSSIMLVLSIVLSLVVAEINVPLRTLWLIILLLILSWSYVTYTISWIPMGPEMLSQVGRAAAAVAARPDRGPALVERTGRGGTTPRFAHPRPVRLTPLTPAPPP